MKKHPIKNPLVDNPNNRKNVILPDNINDLLEIGKSELLSGYHYIAIDAFNKAIKIDQRCEEAYYRRASLRLMYFDPDGAIRDLEKAIAINPQSSGAYYEWGQLMLYENRIEDALMLFDKVTDINPGYEGPAFVQKAIIKFDELKYKEAEKDIQRAIEIDSTFWIAYLVRGRINIALGNFTAALLDLEMYLLHDPDNHYALTRKAELFLNMRRYKDAIHTLDRINNLIGFSSYLITLRCIALFEQKEWAQAITVLGIGIENDKFNAELYKRRSRAKIELGDKESAIIDILEAEKNAPNDGKFIFEIGILFEKLGENEKSRNCFSRAGELGIPEAYQKLKEINSKK